MPPATRRLAPLLPALLLATACAPTYAYTFELTGIAPQAADAPPANVFEDADVKAIVTADPRGLQSIGLTLTNKTDEVLQVRWDKVTLAYPGGSDGSLRPDRDLGWIPPGATRSANLVPFALPNRGDAAAAYEGGVFALHVPMTVRREPRTYQFHLTAHVRKLK